MDGGDDPRQGRGVAKNRVIGSRISIGRLGLMRLIKIPLVKDIVAILHLLITLALHYRAPIRFPNNVNVQVSDQVSDHVSDRIMMIFRC